MVKLFGAAEATAARQRELVLLLVELVVERLRRAWVAPRVLEAEAAPWAEAAALPFEEARAAVSWADALLWVEQVVLRVRQALLRLVQVVAVEQRAQQEPQKL